MLFEKVVLCEMFVLLCVVKAMKYVFVLCLLGLFQWWCVHREEFLGMLHSYGGCVVWLYIPMFLGSCCRVQAWMYSCRIVVVLDRLEVDWQVYH